MIARVSPSNLSGTLFAPPSKSIFQRVVAMALLSEGTTRIINPCFSDDCLSALAMAGGLGARIEESDDDLLIHGGFNPQLEKIDAHESGLGMRLFSAIAALHDGPLTLTGSGSLASRPMHLIQDGLKDFGVEVELSEGKIPLKIQGPLKPGWVEIDGSVSSQFLTGLLIALPTLEEDSELIVHNLVSKPYIDLTLEIMEIFGVSVIHKDYEKFFIPGKQTYKACDIFIEIDWSGAAFLLVAGALAANGEVAIGGLQTQLTQADQSIVGALLFAGSKLKNDEGMITQTAHKIKPFSFDATDCPDLFPPLAALAAFAEGPCRITGTGRLIHKESNRAEAIKTEFAKAGIEVVLEGDTMVIHPSPIQSCTIDGHGDHRIVMAATLLGLFGAPIQINGAEAIAKSYPEFFDDLCQLGGQIVCRKQP